MSSFCTGGLYMQVQEYAKYILGDLQKVGFLAAGIYIQVVFKADLPVRSLTLEGALDIFG